MNTQQQSIATRVRVLEKEIEKLSEMIAAGASKWNDTTRLSIDSSILAVCGLLWGFTSLLHETSDLREARKLTKLCIRQLKKGNLHAETLEQLKSTMISICEEWWKQEK
jgi:hypothetical protein